MIEVAIEGKTSADHDRLLVALDMLMTVDPRVGAQIDSETRQIVLKAGPGESGLGVCRCPDPRHFFKPD